MSREEKRRAIAASLQADGDPEPEATVVAVKARKPLGFRLATIEWGSPVFDHFCQDCDPRHPALVDRFGRGAVTPLHEPDGWTVGSDPPKRCNGCQVKIGVPT